MNALWQGVLYDGRTAAGKRVRVGIGPEGLALTDDGGTVRWPFSELKLVQGRREYEPVRLARGEAALVVAETGFLAGLPPEARRRLVHPRTGRWLAPVAAGLALLLLGAGAGYLLLPSVLDGLAERIPPSWEMRLGDQVASRFLAGLETCDASAADEAAAEIMARLEHAIPDSPYPLRVTFVKHGMVNAFALPGGRVVVMGGLLAAAASPEELAGVLAHETAHIERRHATRAMLRNGSTALLLQLVLGNDSLGGLAAGGLQTLAQLRYTREHEQEADRRGLELLLAAGIDPQGMVDFFSHLAEKEGELGIPAYLSTHPATADRIRAIEQALAARPPEGSQPFLTDPEEWSALKNLCR